MRAFLRRPSLRAAIAVVACSSVLAACGGSTSASGGDTSTPAGEGTGVPFGASDEEYQEAVGDMDEVTITYSTPASPTTATSPALLEYKKLVEQRSGGKIKFDIVWGAALGGNNVTHDLMADGIADMASWAGIYTPDEFPVNVLTGSLMTIGNRDPVVGRMQAFAANLEFGFENDELYTENTYDGQLVPITSMGSTYGEMVLCKDKPADTLANIEGRQVGATTPANAAELKAIGFTPVSVVLIEMFESLQRGVIDCEATPASVMDLTGILPLGDYLTMDPEVGNSLAPTSEAYARAAWEDLPLAAQQILWDSRVDYWKAALPIQYEVDATAAQKAVDEGLEVVEYSEEVREKLREFQTQVREDVAAGKGDAEILEDPAGFVQEFEDTYAKWHEIVVEELGYSEDVPWGEFGEWFAKNPIDVGPFVDRVAEEIIAEHRPGGPEGKDA